MPFLFCKLQVYKLCESSNKTIKGRYKKNFSVYQSNQPLLEQKTIRMLIVHSRSTFRSPQVHSGKLLIRSRSTPGTLLVHSKFTLVNFWYAPGALMVHSWYTDSTLLVHYWYNSGILLKHFRLHKTSQEYLFMLQELLG